MKNKKPINLHLYQTQWEQIQWLLDNHPNPLAKVMKYQIENQIEMAKQNGDWVEQSKNT